MPLLFKTIQYCPLLCVLDCHICSQSHQCIGALISNAGPRDSADRHADFEYGLYFIDPCRALTEVQELTTTTDDMVGDLRRRLNNRKARVVLDDSLNQPEVLLTPVSQSRMPEIILESASPIAGLLIATCACLDVSFIRNCSKHPRGHSKVCWLNDIICSTYPLSELAPSLTTWLFQSSERPCESTRPPFIPFLFPASCLSTAKG